MAISSSATGLRPGVCTSTTRPSAPYNGQTIYETDTGNFYVYSGSSWTFTGPIPQDQIILMSRIFS